MTTDDTRRKKKPNIWLALLPLVFVMAMLLCCLLFLDIEIHIPLLLGTVFAALIGVYGLHYRWEEIEKGIFESIQSGMQPILITGIIGLIIGSWILGGIVPSIIYYGLKILSPRFFLITCMILCSIVSIATGSSWTTAGTVGLALIGIGKGMGIPSPLVAGAVLSGAYFGDKMSPFSDTTNLAPAIAGSTLFAHIRHMIYTTGTSYVLALIGFMFLNRNYTAETMDVVMIQTVMDTLQETFYISPMLLLPLVFIICMVFLRIPAIPGLLLSVAMGLLCAGIFQKADFSLMGTVLQYGYVGDTGNAMVDNLLTRGGLQSMMWTLSLILCSLSFGGVMSVTGMLESVAESILHLAKSTGSLIFATIATCFAMNFASGEQYLSLLITGRMFKDEYAKRGLAPENLSRALEDGGTLTSPLIPWCTCAVAMSTYLGVATMAYLPYCLLNLINPLVSILFGFTGITIKKLNKEQQSTESV